MIFYSTPPLIKRRCVRIKSTSPFVPQPLCLRSFNQIIAASSSVMCLLGYCHLISWAPLPIYTKGYCVTRCGCANNVHPFNGERGNDILFSLYYVRLRGDCFVSEQLLRLIVVSVGKPHRRFPGYGQLVVLQAFHCLATHVEPSRVFGEPPVALRICSAWRNAESVMCSAPPLTVPPFHRWAPPAAASVFVLYELATDPADHKSCWRRSEGPE